MGGFEFEVEVVRLGMNLETPWLLLLLLICLLHMGLSVSDEISTVYWFIAVNTEFLFDFEI